ncbi:MAG: hypothetical protein DMG35_13165 [Acidobacteria bacterium]|nr:MAG: hypothetical protein DMG35_13165 [Acidobacteriota bacterium]
MGLTGAYLLRALSRIASRRAGRAFRLREQKRVGYTFRFAIRPRDLLGERKELQAKLAWDTSVPGFPERTITRRKK